MLGLGDFAHNARGALDHAVYESALRDTEDWGEQERQRALEQVQFPIYTSETAYDGKSGSGPWRIGMLSPEHKMLVRQLQPFGKLDAHLAVLQRMNNWDKHRVISVIGLPLAALSVAQTMRNGARVTSTQRVQNAVINHMDWTPILRVGFDKPSPEGLLGTDYSLRAEVRFDSAGTVAPGELVGPLLTAMLQQVHHHVERLESAI